MNGIGTTKGYSETSGIVGTSRFLSYCATGELTIMPIWTGVILS